uniref:peptidylprolyl isomerase n=1 Tax=Alexandrium monilatum TaxID=311494 RepID=A0A7S4SSU7_9DINO
MRPACLGLVALWLLQPLGAAATDAEGTAFLEENAKKDGVMVLKSGLQYKVIKAATNASAPKPAASDPCVCHYEGTLIDGTVFDSSRKRGSPATFAPNQVIKGWTEALQLMREGDHWQLFIPSDLAYGERGAGGKIKPGAALIFDLELIKVGGDGEIGIMAFLKKPIAGPIHGWHVLLLVGVLGFNMLKSAGGGGGGKKVTASHILVKEEKECQELKAKLEAEKDPEAMSALFKDLAGRHSTCPSGKQAGGSLGEFGPGQMVPAFDKVCWSAPVGEVQGPVQTNFGYHLILVTERKDPEEGKAK